MRIIFVGSGEFGLPTLRALSRSGQLAAVVTKSDRPAGRGRVSTPTPIGRFALEHSLPLVRTDHLDAQSLRAIPPADVMAVIAFGQKIGPEAVNHPRLGSINLHASLLPKYRGAAPINWAILRGEKTAGNSVIRLAERIDSGAILGQSSLQIGELETAGELHDRLAEDGAALMLKVLEDLEFGRAIETPQDNSLATFAPRLSRESADLDWSTSAVEIARKIRGLSPWPGCRVRLVDEGGAEHGHLTLVRAGVVESSESSGGNVGQITSTGTIRAGDGRTSVHLIEVQPEGGRPMPLADYQRGHAWTAGLRLESLLA